MSSLRAGHGLGSHLAEVRSKHPALNHLAAAADGRLGHLGPRSDHPRQRLPAAGPTAGLPCSRGGHPATAGPQSSRGQARLPPAAVCGASQHTVPCSHLGSRSKGPAVCVDLLLRSREKSGCEVPNGWDLNTQIPRAPKDLSPNVCEELVGSGCKARRAKLAMFKNRRVIPTSPPPEWATWA